MERQILSRREAQTDGTSGTDAAEAELATILIVSDAAKDGENESDDDHPDDGLLCVGLGRFLGSVSHDEGLVSVSIIISADRKIIRTGDAYEQNDNGNQNIPNVT